MSNTVIEIKNLSKQYQLGKISTRMLSRDISSALARLTNKVDPNSPLFNNNIKLNFNYLLNILIPFFLFAYVFLWTLPEGFMWDQKVFHSSLFNNLYDLVLTSYDYINDNIIELPLNNFKP